MKKPKKIILTDRDILPFRYLLNYKVMTVKQIWKYPFQGKANIHNVRKRVKCYLDAGFIKGCFSKNNATIFLFNSKRVRGLENTPWTCALPKTIRE